MSAKELALLILEDSDGDARLLLRKLEREGGFAISSAQAQTLASLQALLDRQAWDLIISDHSMPQFTAITALEEIRRRRLDVPLIIVSGTIDPVEAVAAMRAGAKDYLMKDDLARLLPAVERELREADSRREKSLAETALAERTSEILLEREKLSQIAQALEEVVWLTNHDLTEVIYVSPAYERIWGLTCEGLYKSPDDWTRALHPAERDQVVREVQKVLAGGGATEFRILRPDGTQRWVRHTGFPIKDGSGKIVRVAGSTVDITKERQLQAQYLQSQKLDAIGKLAGGVAHDFNNLLTAIAGYSHLLLNALSPEDPNREDVEEIKKTGERAAALTRQLLAFSRQQLLKPQVVDLNLLIAGMSNMLRRLVRADIDLKTVLAKDLGRISVDPGQMEQVLLNLVVNARDALKRDGKITVETADVELGEEYCGTHPDAKPGPYVMLAVSDTGIGMDEGIQARLFEPFFTTKGQGEGTGLGLATVFGIVKQSGGTISVFSEPGHGSVFKVFLPRVELPAAPPLPPAGAPRSVGGDETILLVEDDASVRAMKKRLLSQNGYTVLEAPNAQEAIRIFRRHEEPIHLLLTDIMMPGMRGDDLAEELSRAQPGLKIIFTSGHTEAGIIRHELLSAGAAFLQKPIEPPLLLKTLRELLDERDSANA